MDDFVEQVCDGLSRGEAIVFLGAGFSKQAKNVAGRELPTGAELKAILFSAVSHTPTEDELGADLADIADYCLSVDNGLELVAAALRRTFSIIELQAWQYELLTAYPWRRIYTTNYDDAAEHAFDRAGKQLTTLSALEPYPLNNPTSPSCVHLNGVLSHLTSASVNETLRLSFASYARTRLEGTRWGDLFERDIAFAGAAVFVGFRLPDLEIAQLLAADQVRPKIGFFLGSSNNAIQRAKLSNFGTLFGATGVEFAAALRDKSRRIGTRLSLRRQLKGFRQLTPSSDPKAPTDNDRSNLLSYGDLKQNLVQFDIVARTTERAYTISRSIESDIIAALEQGQDVALVSRLGNGKSVTLERVALRLLAKGWTVFRAIELGPVAESECSELSRYPGKVAVLFDGCLAHEATIKSLGTQRESRIRMIVAERSARFDSRVTDDWLGSRGIAEIFEHRLDVLENEEIDELVSIVDAVAGWGLRNELDPMAKRAFLVRDCRSEIASTLLHVVKSTDMAKRVAEALRADGMTQEERDFLVLATAIGVTTGSVRTTILTKLTSHSALNNFTLKRSEFRTHLYSVAGGTFSLNSSLFGAYFLRELTPAQTVVEVMAKAIRTSIRSGIGFRPRDYTRDESYVSNEFPSSLYVFRNLQQALDTSLNPDAVAWFYEEIRRGTKLEEDPLYWLQYSIFKFFAHDNATARKYLDNAYGVAKRTPGFLTFQIDNQYARQLLDSCSATGDSSLAYEAFVEAHRIVADQAVNASYRHYPFKVAQSYRDILTFHRHSLNEGQRQFVLNAMKTLVSRAKLARVPADRQRVVDQCVKKLSRSLVLEGVPRSEVDAL